MNFAFCPDSAVVSLDDLLYSGQTDAGSGVVVAMQTLENNKQLVSIRHIESGSVVPDEKHLFAVDGAPPEFDLRSGGLAGIFPGIIQQVLQCYAQQSFIPPDNQLWSD